VSGRLPVELTQDADDDLSDIYRYTLETYGETQAGAYFADISDALAALGENADKGPERPDIRAGLRSLPVNKHILFYRVLTDRIRVLRVLSMRRDARRHL